MSGFQEFSRLLRAVHQIPGLEVLLGYTDAHGDLLPLTNDDSLHRALASGPPPLRLLVQKRGEEDGVQWAASVGEVYVGYVHVSAIQTSLSAVPALDLTST